VLTRALLVVTLVATAAACGSGGQESPPATSDPNREAIKAALDLYNADLSASHSRMWFRILANAQETYGTYNCVVSFATDFPGSVLITLYTPKRWQQQLIPPTGRITNGDAQGAEGALPGPVPDGYRCRVTQPRTYDIPVRIVLSE